MYQVIINQVNFIIYIHLINVLCYYLSTDIRANCTNMSRSMDLDLRLNTSVHHSLSSARIRTMDSAPQTLQTNSKTTTLPEDKNTTTVNPEPIHIFVIAHNIVSKYQVIVTIINNLK